MIFFRSFFVLVLLLLCNVSLLTARETERIAIVVNDDIVSLHDFEQQMLLTLVMLDLPDTKKSRNKIGSNVLRNAIDDCLKMQEAKRLKISITKEEIASAVIDLEKKNGMLPNSFELLLKSKGIELETLRRQINVELSWGQIVRNDLVKYLHIGEVEIDNHLSKLKSKNKSEYLISEIFIEKQQSDAKVLAASLVEQLHQGASFSELSKQFSRIGTNNGNLGWVNEVLLENELSLALSKLKKGEISKPILMNDGYHILLMHDKRVISKNEKNEPIYDIMMIKLPILSGSNEIDRNAQINLINNAITSGKNCDDYKKMIKKTVNIAECTINKSIKHSEIPSSIFELIPNLTLKKLSSSIDSGDYRNMFVICDRMDMKDELQLRNNIRSKLEEEQLFLIMKQRMYNLRRDAIIDIRI